MPHSINSQELKKLLSAKPGIVLLDVRRKVDYEDNPEKISTATWYDPNQIDTWIKQLPAEKQVVVYCVKGGPVSQAVMGRLRNEGFNSVFLEGGLKGWNETER